MGQFKYIYLLREYQQFQLTSIYRQNLKIYHYDLTRNIGNEDSLSATACIQACLKFHERATYSPNSWDQDIISSVTYIENENLLRDYEKRKEKQRKKDIPIFEEYLFHGTDKEEKVNSFFDIIDNCLLTIQL